MQETTVRGLTAAEVAQRIAEGRVNRVPDAPVRTVPQILRANIFTRVNAIMLTLLVLILVADSPKDALFAGVIVSNSVIGIVQELRARRTLNQLAVLSAPKARVVRDGAVSEVGVSQVVADDLLALEPGDQVVVDGEVVDAVGLEVDESLLTGESEPVDKSPGDEVLSGSFVAAGSGHYRATRIGAESFASSLSEQARRFELAHSELRRGINLILRGLTIIIPPIAVLVLLRLLDEEERWQDALVGTVAAAVAMVPDGLVLLTSLAFIVGVIALARRRALAKELASVELLARFDTLCLDKTGTITTGEISLAGVEPLGDSDPSAAAAALGAMAAADPSPNPTLRAIAAAYAKAEGWDPVDVVPFSSARKWAAVSFADRGTYFLGAPEMLLDPDDDETRAAVLGHAQEGRRVLLLSRAKDAFQGEDLPARRVPVALVLLEDEVKPDAPEILSFFLDQGVDLKVISGDHPQTVAAVARRAGIPNSDDGFDARNLPDDPEELADLLTTVAVFGRVTPHQKRAMVAAMQRRGRVVAMTGDGVNDVLALKDSDMGIAMGSGSSSTRAVAQLVLLDSSFASLPRVLAEGRKVINNIERVANLFIAKAAYAVVLAAIVGVAGVPYPLLPRQLTLIGTFSVGVPGFFLALAPNTQLVKKGFLERVLRYSIPAGVAAAVCAFAAYEIVRRADSATLDEARSVATVTLLAIGLVILVMIARPLAPWKIGLAVLMGLGYTIAVVVEPIREYFELDLPPGWVWGVTAAASVLGGLLVVFLPRLLPWGSDAG